MSCETFQKDLLLHADGELRGQASLNLLAHLKICPECARKIYAHQQLKAAIARVMCELKAPTALQASISSLLDAQAGGTKETIPAGSNPKVYRIHWPAAIAAVIALALVGLWQFQPWAEKPNPYANLQGVQVSDEGPVAVELAKSIHGLHIKCAMLGPAHQDPNLPHDAEQAASELSKTMSLPVLSGTGLRLPSGAKFDTVHLCMLDDAKGLAHRVAHLLYRDGTNQPISLVSMVPFGDVTGLKTRSVNGRDYAVLAPAVSTKCHPVTIVLWNGDRVTYMVCAPFGDQETLQYVEPLRLAIESNPSVPGLMLAALTR